MFHDRLVSAEANRLETDSKSEERKANGEKDGDVAATAERLLLAEKEKSALLSAKSVLAQRGKAAIFSDLGGCSYLQSNSDSTGWYGDSVLEVTAETRNPQKSCLEKIDGDAQLFPLNNRFRLFSEFESTKTASLT